MTGHLIHFRMDPNFS